MSEKHVTRNIINSEKLEVHNLNSDLVTIDKRGDFYRNIKEEF